MAEPVSQISGALEAVNWMAPEQLEKVREALSKTVFDVEFKNVRDAAKELGAGTFLLYQSLYKLFSKLAHPTALVVKGNLRSEAGKNVGEAFFLVATQLMKDILITVVEYLKVVTEGVAAQQPVA